MTRHEFNHILGSINALSPEQLRQLRHELDSKLAAAETTPASGQDSASVPSSASEDHPILAPKTILDMVDELRGRVPPEEFSKLPKDGASQLDHYLHGTPKRPTS